MNNRHRSRQAAVRLAATLKIWVFVVQRIVAKFLEQAFHAVTRRARQDKLPHRMAAMAIGVERVLAAKKSRGLFP